MNADALGRLIKVGDVCGYAHRRRSSIFLEPIIIRSVEPGGVRGDKLVKEWSREGGWQVKKTPTKLIVRPSHMIITGITEQEAVELMQIRSER